MAEQQPPTTPSTPATTSATPATPAFPPPPPSMARPAPQMPAYDRHRDRDLGHSAMRDHHVQADAHTGLTADGQVVIPPDEHPERHEHTDVSVRGITYTGVAIAVVTAIALLIISVVQAAFISAQREDNERGRRTALEPAEQRPPADVPVVQGVPSWHPATPRNDMDLWRKETVRQLSTYGQREDGTAHIPVRRAMELALERGAFPARQNAPPPEGGARQRAGTGEDAGNQPNQQPSDPARRVQQGPLQTRPPGSGAPQPPQQGGSHGAR